MALHSVCCSCQRLKGGLLSEGRTQGPVPAVAMCFFSHHWSPSTCNTNFTTVAYADLYVLVSFHRNNLMENGCFSFTVQEHRVEVKAAGA